MVIWLYLFLKSFINIQGNKLAHAVLLFAYTLEFAQFYKLVNLLGLEHIKVARIILGSTFDWLDILAYTIGWTCILIFENSRYKRLNKPLPLHLYKKKPQNIYK